MPSNQGLCSFYRCFCHVFVTNFSLKSDSHSDVQKSASECLEAILVLSKRCECGANSSIDSPPPKHTHTPTLSQSNWVGVASGFGFGWATGSGCFEACVVTFEGKMAGSSHWVWNNGERHRERRQLEAAFHSPNAKHLCAKHQRWSSLYLLGKDLCSSTLCSLANNRTIPSLTL